MAPIPAQPSRNVAPSTRAPRMLKTVSRNLSLVGRSPGGGVPFRRLLLNFPEMIRIKKEHKRHKKHKTLCLLCFLCSVSLSHSNQPCPCLERLNQAFPVVGSLNPALSFFLRQ